jgi:hypothetical protein
MRWLTDPDGKYDYADLVSFAQLVTFEDLRAAGLKVAVGFNEQLHRVSSAAVPPYLQKMEYRDGGYAILRALWDLERQPGWQGYATIEEICAVGQKYCNVSLKNDHWSGNDHGYGWESNKSLCKYDLIKVEKSCQRVGNSFRSARRQVRVNDEGKRFVPKMLEKFSEQDDPLESGGIAHLCPKNRYKLYRPQLMGSSRFRCRKNE